MSNEIEIANKKIGVGQEVFVIAEIGINHNGSIETAQQLIDAACEAGVSAVKFQTYITEKRAPKDSPIFPILKKCEISFSEQEKLFKYAREKKVEVFSTPFDDASVAFLASIDVPAYKIASFDIVNKKLLRSVAEQGKPVIVSRGMATSHEIDDAISIFHDHNVPYCLLHCVSAYPVTAQSDLNLRTIAELEKRYNCPVGFSDHTLGIEASLYAVAAGATVIEKHFTLSRQADGPDHALSTEPEEMKDLVEGVRRVNEMMGHYADGPVASERDIVQYRRES